MKILIITGLSYRKPNLSSLVAFLRKNFHTSEIILPKKFKRINRKPETSTLLSYYLLGYVAQSDIIVSYLNGPSSGRTIEQLYALLLGIPVIGVIRGKILSPFDLIGIKKTVKSKRELVKEIKKRIGNLSLIAKIIFYLKKKLFFLIFSFIFFSFLKIKRLGSIDN
jgi:hypothetical protein